MYRSILKSREEGDSNLLMNLMVDYLSQYPITEPVKMLAFFSSERSDAILIQPLNQ